MLTLIVFAISVSQQVEIQRAAERIRMGQIFEQRFSMERKELEAQWAAEDRYAIAQRTRKATPAELDRLIVPGGAK